MQVFLTIHIGVYGSLSNKKKFNVREFLFPCEKRETSTST